MAAFLSLTDEQFVADFVVFDVPDNAFKIAPKSNDPACRFLKDAKCSVYSVRPTQCETFPYWHGNLASEAHWRTLATICEGAILTKFNVCTIWLILGGVDHPSASTATDKFVIQRALSRSALNDVDVRNLGRLIVNDLNLKVYLQKKKNECVLAHSRSTLAEQ